MSVAICLVRLFFLQVTFMTCLAGIVIKPTTSEDAHGLIDATVRMLKSCRECQENGIGVVGGPLDDLVSSLISKPSIPVVLLDTRRPDYNPPVTSSEPHKLQLFLIMASSSSKLHDHLASAKKSRWWNHMADFWLVKWPARENDCTKAYAFLWTAWRMNILEAKFICIHGTRGKLIYGFNPYTKYAPDRWRLENVYDGENKHPWSLLSRELSSAPESCRNMTFDKSENLGGYEIRITVIKGAFKRFFPNETGIDAIKCPACSRLRMVLRSLNATAKLLVHEANEPLGSFDATGNVNGILAETYYGISDLSLHANTHVETPELRRLLPYHYTGVSIMTQYSGSASQVEKIASLVDVNSRVGLLLVCLLTFIFLKYNLRQTWGTAGLNVLRLICNSCLTTLPSATSSRIYLGSLFVFVVTFQGIYQGGLASLLAKSVSLGNIENIEDLRKSHHTIYAHEEYGTLFSDPEFQGRFVGLEYYNCTRHVLQSPMHASLELHEYAVPDAAWFKLHISKDFIVPQSLAFPIREDWPLERKFNHKFQALSGAGLLRFTSDFGMKENLEIIEATKNENRDRRFKTLDVVDLKFAFVILAIGLTIAAITFVVEVIRG